MIKTHTKGEDSLMISTKNRYKWRSRMFRTMFKTRDKLDNIRMFIDFLFELLVLSSSYDQCTGHEVMYVIALTC